MRNRNYFENFFKFIKSIANSNFIKSTIYKIRENMKKGNVLIYYLIFIICFLMISPIAIYIFLGRDKKDSSHIEYSLQDSSITKSDIKIKLYNTKEDKIEEIPLEEYICGVVASEMPASFHIEALKAQAVAARTFVMAKIKNKCNKAKGAQICDTTHCQVYLNEKDKKESWGSKANDNWNKIVQAINDTKGKVLTYKGELVVNPQFFATSSGKTESSKDVFASSIPYLQSVDSPGEEVAPKFKSTKDVTYKEFVNKINSTYGNGKMNLNNVKSQIKILDRTDSGMVKEIQLGKVKIKGTDFRNLFNLNSANFKLEFKKNSIAINCLGYGHGVGMSQWGANSMAKSGESYDKILMHYYTGVKIKNINK